MRLSRIIHLESENPQKFRWIPESRMSNAGVSDSSDKRAVMSCYLPSQGELELALHTRRTAIQVQYFSQAIIS